MTHDLSSKGRDYEVGFLKIFFVFWSKGRRVKKVEKGLESKGGGALILDESLHSIKRKLKGILSYIFKREHQYCLMVF